MDDPFQLTRFLTAQDHAGIYAEALSELRTGRKRSHWMWFVFPQVAGLGQSSMARAYAIESLAEAEAYVEHPVLGDRLLECAGVLSALAGRTAEDVFGPIDAIKLRSSMTLFARAAPGHEPFQTVLDDYFGGIADDLTEALLDRGLKNGRSG